MEHLPTAHRHAAPDSLRRATPTLTTQGGNLTFKPMRHGA